MLHVITVCHFDMNKVFHSDMKKNNYGTNKLKSTRNDN